MNKACGTIADFTFEELCDKVSTPSSLVGLFRSVLIISLLQISLQISFEFIAITTTELQSRTINTNKMKKQVQDVSLQSNR